MAEMKVFFDGRFDAGLRFDNFVAGEANQFAIDAAKNFTELNNGHHGPLLIYGERGSGKSHLAHAIANMMQEYNPQSITGVCYASGFVKHVEQAYKTQAIAHFRHYCHSLDFLVVDDIGRIANQARSQKELIYACDSLSAAHKHVALTIDTSSENIIDNIPNGKFVSWFSSGLFVTLKPPELELRIAILDQKAKQRGYALDMDTALFIVNCFNSNIRELESALMRTIAYAMFHRCNLTVETAKEALHDRAKERGLLGLLD